MKNKNLIFVLNEKEKKIENQKSKANKNQQTFCSVRKKNSLEI